MTTQSIIEKETGYVGAKSKKLAYPNACCMRKVISLGEELEHKETLPFPFKYLREYIEQR